MNEAEYYVVICLFSAFVVVYKVVRAANKAVDYPESFQDNFERKYK